MTLSTGTKLGPYEIVSPLGKGGMGEVYRARDSNLDREVAIKVLPDFYSRDPERVARFEREAKVLASLNHPHIAAIYGFEESDGKRYLVMELVEGQTLSERIRSGSMPVEEALTVGKQIAEALETAHNSGIIHRDLKPANVKVTPEGEVKVLDFGLAKALMTGSDASQTGIADLPTLTAQHSPTSPGVILGTAAYMSPEQARGKAIDKRTDIWAFGCVLFECLGGRRPFDGETTTDMIAKVLEREPDWDTVPADTPPIVKGLLQRCLQKDPKDRLRDIGEAWIVLNGALTGEVSGLAMGPFDSQAKTAASRSKLPWTISAVLTLGLVASLATLWRATRPVVVSPIHVKVEIDHDHPLFNEIGAQFALSPDGKLLVYVAGDEPERKLFLRRLDQLESTLLSGTAGAEHPFFSPDGKWIAFFANAKLKKISISGGSPLSLCDAADNRGGTWSENGTIVFTPTTTTGLHRVQAAGGAPEVLTDPTETEERSHRWPHFTPDGKHVVFTSQRRGDDFNNASIEVIALDTLERTVLHRGGSYGRYLPSGHLIYLREATVFCARLGTNPWKLNSTPAPVLEAVKFDPRNGGAQLAFSGIGSMAYFAGRQVVADTSLVWVDRAGIESPLIPELRNYFSPQFSPDGKQLAVTIFRPDSSDEDIWLYDLERRTLTRLTFGEFANRRARWSPDGSSIAFMSERNGVEGDLYLKRTDGSSEAELLLDNEFPQWPVDFTPDGKTLIYGEWHGETLGDLWTMEISGERNTEPYLVTPFIEYGGDLSPDGKWLAYGSNESGNSQIYVRPFPKSSGKWQISADGGRFPTWAPDGKELFFLDGDKMMHVAIETTEDSIIAGRPDLLFEFRAGGPSFGKPYDVVPDGERFVMIKDEGDEIDIDRSHLRFVFNWFDELRTKVPVE